MKIYGTRLVLVFLSNFWLLLPRIYLEMTLPLLALGLLNVVCGLTNKEMQLTNYSVEHMANHVRNLKSPDNTKE